MREVKILHTWMPCHPWMPSLRSTATFCHHQPRPPHGHQKIHNKTPPNPPPPKKKKKKKPSLLINPHSLKHHGTTQNPINKCKCYLSTIHNTATHIDPCSLWLIAFQYNNQRGKQWYKISNFTSPKKKTKIRINTQYFEHEFDFNTKLDYMFNLCSFSCQRSFNLFTSYLINIFFSHIVNTMITIFYQFTSLC